MSPLLFMPRPNVATPAPSKNEVKVPVQDAGRGDSTNAVCALGPEKKPVVMPSPLIPHTFVMLAPG